MADCVICKKLYHHCFSCEWDFVAEMGCCSEQCAVKVRDRAREELMKEFGFTWDDPRLVRLNNLLRQSRLCI